MLSYSYTRRLNLYSIMSIAQGPISLRWRHNGRDSVSNHQPHDCLLNLLFRRRLKKTSKLRVTGLYAWNSPGSGNPQFGSKSAIFVPCDLEIWRMTLKNNRAPLLCSFKLCASFHSHQWIQTRVAVWKRPIWVKFDDFLAVWSWNLMNDIEKQYGTSP